MPLATTSDRAARVARLALLGLFPLYPLVPRYALAGPLGIDDLIPVATAAAALVALLLGLLATSRANGASAPLAGRLGAGLLHDPALLGLTVFGAIATVSALSHVESVGAGLVAMARVAGRLGLYGVLLLATRHLLDDRGRRRLIAVLVAIAVVEGAFGLIAYVAKIQGPWNTGMIAYPPDLMPPSGRARVQGTFGGQLPAGELFLNRANFYSAYLAVSVAGLVALWGERRRPRLVAVGAALVVGGILASLSRMSLVAALVGLGIATLAWRRRAAVVAAALVVVTVVAVVGLVPPLRERFVGFHTDRVEQWQLAARVIAAHPLTGAGDGRYLAVAERLAEGIDVPVVRTPHNSVLYAMASYGIVAGLALVGLYLALIWSSVRLWRARPGPLAIAQLVLVGTFLVHDLTNNLFFVPEVALMFWALYGAARDSEPTHAAVGPDRLVRHS